MLRDDVSVLYVDPRGPYPKLVSDWWDEKRDARKYAGPNPVVAHPPCGGFGKLRHLYGGHDRDCAFRALEQVRHFGGVLEHPAGSKLWENDFILLEHLGRFEAHVDCFGGWCTWLDQVEWGHVARKRTWIYVVSDRRTVSMNPPYPGASPTHWIGGGRTNSSRNGAPIPMGIKACSAQQRRRTPIAFAEWLIELASHARPT